LAVEVAMLSLPDTTNVCYALAVTNDAGALVWRKDHLCADRYGNTAGGDLAFVGTCDATERDGAGASDGTAWNTVTLAVENVYTTAHPWTGDPLRAGDDAWQNPCVDDAGTPALEGCQRRVACVQNQDAQVPFDLTVMRQANQGFFDIGVSFEDIFCSAKVDCSPSLLANPQTGARGPTATLAFACTAGAGETTLYLDPIEVTCDDGEKYTVSPVGAGNLGAREPGLYQVAAYHGTESLVGYDKCYWNTTLGLDLSTIAPDDANRLGKNCHVKTRATAAQDAFAIPFTSPASAVYPVIAVDVPLTDDAGALVCTQNPLNGSGSGVRTAYTDGSASAGTTFVASMACGAEPVAACGPTAPTVGLPDSDSDGAKDACDACPQNAQLATFNWVTWPTAFSGQTTTGTVGGTSVTYTSSQNLETSTGLFDYTTTFGAQAVVPVPNPSRVIRNTLATTNTVTFGRPVSDPILVFASIGNALTPGTTVPVLFSSDIVVLWKSAGVTQSSNRRIDGREGYAVVQIPGVHTQVTFEVATAESWMDVLIGFGGDATADRDRDGVPDVCDTGLVENVGCSDGHREGFVNTSIYPDIAACSGGWDQLGLINISDTCGNASGDDYSANPTGTHCSAEDLCAVGWSICENAVEVAAKGGGASACTNMTSGSDLSGDYLFVTKQRSVGNYICDTGLDPSGTNDAFGCGNYGEAISGNCAPLNHVTPNQCVGIDPPWDCTLPGEQVGNSNQELVRLTKTTAAKGGVLCCRD